MASSFEQSAFNIPSPSIHALTDHSSTTKSTRHSSPPPIAPSLGYRLVRKTPRPFSSIEQFDFKSIPIPPIPTPPPPVATACPSGLTELSSINTSDVSTAILVKQSRHHNENVPHELDTLGPTSIDATSNSDDNTKMTSNYHQQQQQRQRNYHSFPGKHIFFCDGRLMTSRAYWAFIIGWTLLVVPSVLFGIFTCPFIWTNIHPVIPLLFAYLFVLAVASMLKTSWTDPGVLPRGLEPLFDHQSSISTSQPLPMDRCVKIKDDMWYIKYCSTCHIYRPPRASHCRQCDNCVENEDHHCIWLNNCIGKRNYRPFFTFITTCTVMAIYVIVFTVLHLLMAARQIQPNIDFHLVIQTTPVSFVLAIVGFFLLWMVGGLTLYHCHLIWKGLTTHEKLRSTLWEDVSQPNPYAMTSPMLNIAHVLCRPQPKSHLRRRKYPDTP